MNAVVCDYQSEMEEKEDDEAEMSRSENCCITYLSYRKMNGFFIKIGYCQASSLSRES